MTAINYESLALAWTPDNKRDHTFNRLVVIVLLVTICAALFVSSIELPKIEKTFRNIVPERIAKFIVQKAKLNPPKPKYKPKPKPKPRPKLRIKKIQKDKPALKKPLTKIEKQARKQAEKSGLLALGNELADLMDTSAISGMVGKRVKQTVLSNRVANANTALLSSNVGKGSGGISSDKYNTVISKTTLSQSERFAVRKAIVSTSSPDKSSEKIKRNQYRGDDLRSEEDIAFIMDQNKSKLHSIYRRARRSNPGIKGKIVLAITILPSGKVSSVIVKSSELNDEKLESRLVARIKGFDFGGASVELITVIFPIEFLPS